MPTARKSRRTWTCFHCGERFRSAVSARDHFGADESAEAACRIKGREERGLLRALRRAEAEIVQLRRENEQLDQAAFVAESATSALRRKIQAPYRPGLTIEELIEHIHVNTPEHGGTAFGCGVWPCTMLGETHRFLPWDAEQVAIGAPPDDCALCCESRTHGNHGLALSVDAVDPVNRDTADGPRANKPSSVASSAPEGTMNEE